MEIFASAIQNGVEKINECRRKLDLQDAPGGDRLIVNGNFIPLEEVGNQYKDRNAQQEQTPGANSIPSEGDPPDTPKDGSRGETTETDPDKAKSQEGGEEDEE
jgi:hypothetical protein